MKLIFILFFVIPGYLVFSGQSDTSCYSRVTGSYKNGGLKFSGLSLDGKNAGTWIYFTEGGSADKIVIYNDNGKVDRIIYNYDTNYQVLLSLFLAATVVLAVLLIKEKGKKRYPAAKNE